MELVNCDLCGSADNAAVAHQTDRLHATTDENFTVVRCAGCGLHYLNPRPGPNEISRYYGQGYSFHALPSRMRRAAGAALEWLANSPFASLLAIWPPMGRRLVAHLKPGLRDPVRAYFKAGGRGSFLDIGCGSGVHAHFWGYRGSLLAYRALAPVAGVETAAGARAALANAGVAVHASLAEVPAGESFGMIRMNWSLEHVHAPSDYFRFIADRLIPGGQAVIAVPNYGGMLYRLAPDCVEVPVHLYHFRTGDIHRYAQKVGLKVRQTVTFSYPQMFVVAARAGMLPLPFTNFENFSEARAFAHALKVIDQCGMGNDVVVTLEKPHTEGASATDAQ